LSSVRSACPPAGGQVAAARILRNEGSRRRSCGAKVGCSRRSSGDRRRPGAAARHETTANSQRRAPRRIARRERACRADARSSSPPRLRAQSLKNPHRVCVLAFALWRSRPGGTECNGSEPTQVVQGSHARPSREDPNPHSALLTRRVWATLLPTRAVLPKRPRKIGSVCQCGGSGHSASRPY
jgi:hypothetical protein